MDKQKEDDVVAHVEDIQFVAESFMVESFKEFDIDYSDHFLRRGFSVQIHGQEAGSC